MTPDAPLRELNGQQDTVRPGVISRVFSLQSVWLAGGSLDRNTASAAAETPSQAAAAATAAATPRKCRRKVPSCPAAVLLTAALVCLAAATATALPGGSGTTTPPGSQAAASGCGGRRRTSWAVSSRKSGGSEVAGGAGGNVFETGGGVVVHADGAGSRHRKERLHPSQPRRLLLLAGLRGSRGQEIGASEALRVRGGGRPWFTGYEDTTEAEDASSEEGETTDYEGSSTEDETDTSESDRDYRTDDGESSEWQEEGEDEEEERDPKEASEKTDADERASTSPISRAIKEDVYARTVARRRAMALAFRVLQRALMRTAFLLVAFQILPWLKHNFIAQCLLVGSLVLQTATELVAIARSAETSGKQGNGEQGQEGSGSGKGAGKDGSSSSPTSSSSAGLIGGIMKVFSPESEHVRHLDFHRLNDLFDKDVEALAAAEQPKLDVPKLLATGAAEGSGFPVAGMVMKAFKGFAGDKKSEDGGANKKKEPKKKAAKNSKAWGKNTKKRGSKKAAEDERSEKHGIVGSKDAHGGAEKGSHDNDNIDNSLAHNGPTPLAVDGSSGTQSELRNPSSEGQQAVEVENFSLEHIRYENKSEAERGTAGSQTGANPAGAGTAEAVRTGGAATVQPSVAAAQNSTASDQPPRRVFVVSFRPGHSPDEAEKQQMDLLSLTASFLIANGNNATDEVVVLLESGGGEVTAFGLAATKLARLRDSGFTLTVCVDKVAASGGYMMACVADKLVVAPFAMLGSIGVVGGMPNFSKVLKKNGVDYFHFTAGQHKSLVGPFQEVTKGNLAMQQKQMDAIHHAFKNHVHRYRPAVDVETVGTGEVWLGQDAVELRLADEVGTAMEYLQGRMPDAQVFLVKEHKKKLGSGSGLVRALLLGPLSAAANFASSVSIIAQAIKQLQRGTAGGVHGASSRSGAGGSDSLTRALLAAKGYAHAAGLGGAGQHGPGAGTQRGVSGRASPFEGAGYLASVPGAELEGNGGADLLGGSRNSIEAAAAGGGGADGGWVF